MPYYRPCPLERRHKAENFDCGKPALNAWLKDMALYNQQQSYTRSFVIADAQQNIVGYYALCASMFYKQDMPRHSRDYKAPREIPVVLLARMGIDKKHQGQKLGKALLRDALLNAVSAGQIIAFHAVITHPIDMEAESFYLHHDFKPIKNMKTTLFISAKDILTSLRAGLSPSAP